MKTFLPGVAVGMLLLLLFQKNYSDNRTDHTFEVTDRKRTTLYQEGYDRGLLDCQSAMKLDNQRIFDEGYQEGHIAATAEYEQELQRLRDYFESDKYALIQSHKLTLQDSVSSATNQLKIHFARIIADTVNDVTNRLEAEYRPTIKHLIEENKALRSEYQFLYRKMEKYRIDPVSLNWAKIMIITFAIGLLFVALFNFLRIRFKKSSYF